MTNVMKKERQFHCPSCSKENYFLCKRGVMITSPQEGFDLTGFVCDVCDEEREKMLREMDGLRQRIERLDNRAPWKFDNAAPPWASN
jgi:transcription initiation factor IIE alpha subunit